MSQFLFSSDRPARRCEISECGTWRYALQEGDTKATPLVWIMLNPSTADAYQDDPTIRKVRGFTKRFGFERWIVVNLFSFRATDPKACAKLYASDPIRAIGPLSDEALGNVTSDCKDIVVAWGAQPWARKRTIDVLDLLARQRRSPRCLGVSKDGHPFHPLMQPYSRTLAPFLEAA